MSKPLPIISYLAAAFEAEAELIEGGALVGKDSEKLCPVTHSFGDGCYIREWNCPPNVVTVSKVHKIAHPFFVLKGRVSVLSQTGIETLEAPHYGITQPGTKRVLFTHSDTTWVTVHVTDKKDLDEIEADIISSNPAEELDLAALMEAAYLEESQ